MTTLTAHSGSENTQPNSMEYLKVACNENAYYVEIDVRHTKDGFLVLNHDDAYENILLSESNWCDIKDMYNLLSFEEAVNFIISRGNKVNADIKTIESIPKVADYLLSNKIVSEVLLTGCRDKEIKYLYHHYPMLNKIYNVDELFEDISLTEENKRQKIMKNITLYGASGINIPYRALTEERYLWTKENKISIFVWTVDEREEMIKNFEREVTSITTNCLKLFHEVKRSE